MHLPIRQTLALVLLTLTSGTATVKAEVFNLETATIRDINKAMDSGALTSEMLVRMYLQRIEAYDKKGPAINTVITLQTNAIAIARELDSERRTSGPRSELHGIPVILKDLFDTYDMPTSGGFLPLKDSQPWRDGFIVDKLRKAGAIIFAKVNTLDWFSSQPWGSSTVIGQTKNPYALEYVPGASSSGTGAGIAAYFATVGFGSETGVSIRNPTSENNLVGLAPTLGLVSRTGMIMSALTHERGGPMTRNVYDLAATLGIVAGFDAEDLVTMASRGKIPEGGYTQFLDPENGLKGARIGVLRDMFRSGPERREGLALIEKAIEDLKSAGATIIDPVSTGLPLFEILSETRVSVWEKKLATDYYLAGLGPDAVFKSTEEMVRKHPDLVSNSMKRTLEFGPLDFDRQYLSRLKNRSMLQEAILSLMDKYELDALVYPFKTLPATKISEGWNNRAADNPLSSQTGYPGLLVPAGFTSKGLPIALEFLGRPFDEPVLIKLASAYEHVSGHRKTPPNTPPLPGEIITYNP